MIRTARPSLRRAPLGTVCALHLPFPADTPQSGCTGRAMVRPPPDGACRRGGGGVTRCCVFMASPYDGNVSPFYYDALHPHCNVPPGGAVMRLASSVDRKVHSR